MLSIGQILNKKKFIQVNQRLKFSIINLYWQFKQSTQNVIQNAVFFAICKKFLWRSEVFAHVLFFQGNQANRNSKSCIFCGLLKSTHHQVFLFCSIFMHLQLINIFRQATHGTIIPLQTWCWFEGSSHHTVVNLSISWAPLRYKNLSMPIYL